LARRVRARATWVAQPGGDPVQNAHGEEREHERIDEREPAHAGMR
jgi:hypothetical protein